jgi:peroxiredoxin
MKRSILMLRGLKIVAIGIVAAVLMASGTLIAVPVAEAQAAAGPASLAMGAAAPQFNLPGVDGKNHQLSDYASAKVLAVVFECDHCPESELYEARIEKLYQDYKDKGVALVAINPDSPNSVRRAEMSYSDLGESMDDMKARAAMSHLQYPYLDDGATQSVSLQYGPAAMPEIFIFDHGRELRYEGRIDDNLNPAPVKSRDARNAIDALLAGEPVALAQTVASGCAPDWLSSGAAAVQAETAAIDAAPVTLTLATKAVLGKLRPNPTGKVLLINFWATWCGPCVAEFPDLQDTYQMYRNRGLAMVTVSENDPAAKGAVLQFLQKEHAATPNMVFALEDVYAMQDAFDPDMGSAVPYTVVLSPDGDVLYQEQGDVTILALRRAILANLPDSKAYPGIQAYWAANSNSNSN